MNEEQNPHYYETGNTTPPKSRVWFVCLLILLILLGGIITVTSIMNVKLFRAFSLNERAEETPVYFSADPAAENRTPTIPQAPVAEDQTITISLETTPQSVENIPQQGGLSLQEIYAGAIDSVVSILCATPGGESSGTGVILSQDGYIITNAHVVENATTLTVLLNNGNRLIAQLVGMDKVSDLAVLYVEDSTITPAQFGDSDALRVGDAVVAIGDPLGVELRGTMTDGIVSAINRDIYNSGRTLTLIQTNAALNAGNSGGPLLNCYGQVVGINTLKIGDYMDDAGVEGLGFAIPSKTVKEIAEQLISQGFVSGRPSLGFTTETVSTFLQVYYHLPQGVYISQIQSDSSAARCGLEPGDILLAMDGQRITDTETLQNLLYRYKAGDTVELHLYRADMEYVAVMTLEEATA